MQNSQYFFVLANQSAMQSSKFLEMRHTTRDICSNLLHGILASTKNHIVYC